MPEYDPVTKISIVPRGNAGGLTFFAPSEERLESGLYTRGYLENQMAVALGGRVAEELIFGEDEVTTGASGDFQQVPIGMAKDTCVCINQICLFQNRSLGLWSRILELYHNFGYIVITAKSSLMAGCFYAIGWQVCNM